MWLLNANLDIRICDAIVEFGIECHTAQSRGWKHLVNGKLVSAAAAEGFTCVLTRDQLFAESAAKALKQFPDFAVVFIQLNQQRRLRYVAEFRAAWLKRPIVPIKGKSIDWPTA